MDQTIKPQLLVAMGCDPTRIWRDDLGASPDRDPPRDRYLVANLTNPRTLIHSKRLADVAHRFVFLSRSEVRPRRPTNHSKQLQRREILEVGRAALDRRGNQDDPSPEVRDSPSLAHDHAPLSMRSTKGTPKAIRIIEGYRRIRPEARPILGNRTANVGVRPMDSTLPLIWPEGRSDPPPEPRTRRPARSTWHAARRAP